MDLYPFKINALEGSDIEFIFSAPISPVGVSICTGCTLKQLHSHSYECACGHQWSRAEFNSSKWYSNEEGDRVLPDGLAIEIKTKGAMDNPVRGNTMKKRINGQRVPNKITRYWFFGHHHNDRDVMALRILGPSDRHYIPRF